MNDPAQPAGCSEYNCNAWMGLQVQFDNRLQLNVRIYGPLRVSRCFYASGLAKAQARRFVEIAIDDNPTKTHDWTAITKRKETKRKGMLLWPKLH